MIQSLPMAPPNPDISVVVLTLNEGGMLKSTVDALDATLPDAAEIVIIDDGSTDGSADFLEAGSARRRLFRAGNLGVARGRNFGARQARGNTIVFSDAHIEPPPGWWEPLVDVLKDPVAGAVGPGIADFANRERRGFGMRFINPYLEAEWICPEYDDVIPAPLLPGGFWAIRRETFDRTGGLDEGMLRWGAEDFEFSLRLWMMGYEMRVAPEVEVAHLFRKAGPYPVDGKWPRHNQLRAAYIHFSEARFERVRQALTEYEGYEEGYRLFEESAAPARRAQVRAQRIRDDDWYFQTFGEI
jgi:GT2 family glycosyltransferase